MARLNNNRGILLISTFMVAGVLFVLSGAYMSSAIVQNRAVQRQKDSMQVFYAAEKGAEYVFAESQNHGWGFATHEVADTDLDGDGKINDLVRIAAGPTVSLTGASINAVTGCYEVYAPQGNVEVKVYNNPLKNNETILLSRSTSTKADSVRIIKNRLSHRSMYEYLMFFPGSQYFGGSYDGKGVGGMHINGDIILGGANFANLTELSASGYIYYNYSNYRPPYSADDWDGKRDGLAPMLKVSYPPYNYCVPGCIINNQGSFFASGAKINSVAIPKELSSEWQWDKYWGTDGNLNPGGKPELPVTIVVPPQELARVGAKDANDYWIKVYGKKPSWVNPEWWGDKVYGNDRANYIESVPVKYTNSSRQPDAWRDFIKSKGLDMIVTEKNSGGKYLAPLNIETNYSDLAKKAGLYVGKDGLGNTEVYLNGVKQDVLPCWIEDNVRFFNSVRPHVVSGTPVKENVIQFDVGKLVSGCPENKPNNNIIYVGNKNLRLVNATKLPDQGLTVVSPYNVYLKGNYNTDTDWQPSAVITNSLVYTLSESFNDPQVLPESYDYKEYPYSLEFQKFLDQYASGSRYPKSLPEYPKSGITPPWVKANLTGYQQKTLLDKGEYYYDVDNESLMANRAPKNTIYNVAIAAPYSPYPYSLERWSGKRTVEGSFIQLENSWSVKRDVPSNYGRKATKGWGGSSAAWDPSSQYNYEEQFKGEGARKPAGDFLSGAQARWEVVTDFNHDI